MSDTISALHYKRFLEEVKIPEYNARIIKIKEDFAARKVLYENKSIPKFFGWKYENSCSYYEDSWYSYNPEYYLELVERELNRLEYQIKSEREHTTMKEFDLYSQFYAWCKENKIPR